MIKLHDIYKEIFSRINALSSDKLHVYDELVDNPQWPFI